MNENDLWFKNINVLFYDLTQFFPTNNLSKSEKINAIARFSIFYTILILIFGCDLKWLALSVILIFISIYLGYYENFETVQNNENDNELCTKPTEDNPFMNFTLNDYINNPNKKKACSYDTIKNDIQNNFKKNIVPDPNDIWGTNISDRNFFTMPWTQIVNDQTELGRLLYSKAGECKNLGLNCDKNRDNRYHHSRYYF
jgi:hypothetical protein